MDRLSASFETDGFVVEPAVLSDAECSDLEATVSTLDPASQGARELLGFDWARQLARQLRDVHWLRLLLGSSRTAIQCTYFPKLPSRNWLVSLHQDVAIPVAEKNADATCTGWSLKHGTWFCQPSVSVLERLVAVRVHLDDNTEANGPLRIIPGSHRLGRIAFGDIRTHRERLGEIACVAPRGAVVAMRPLLLHASSKSTSGAPRRVLHFVFGPTELPSGLQWKHAI